MSSRRQNWTNRSHFFLQVICNPCLLFKSDFSTPVLWGEWRRRRQQTEEWVRGGGGGERRQYAGSGWTTGRTEGEPCQNQHAFGETCFSCWIQGLPVIPVLSGCYCTFTVFTVDSVGPDFRDTNHPVWEQSQLNDSQNCTKLDSCSYWLETILSKLLELVRQGKSSFGLECILKSRFDILGNMKTPCRNWEHKFERFYLFSYLFVESLALMLQSSVLRSGMWKSSNSTRVTLLIICVIKKDRWQIYGLNLTSFKQFLFVLASCWDQSCENVLSIDVQSEKRHEVLITSTARLQVRPHWLNCDYQLWSFLADLLCYIHIENELTL